eukprot:scaffold41508_cov37-Tisochrysis_lutea.AAC.2
MLAGNFRGPALTMLPSELARRARGLKLMSALAIAAARPPWGSSRPNVAYGPFLEQRAPAAGILTSGGRGAPSQWDSDCFGIFGSRVSYSCASLCCVLCRVEGPSQGSIAVRTTRSTD